MTDIKGDLHSEVAAVLPIIEGEEMELRRLFVSLIAVVATFASLPGRLHASPLRRDQRTDTRLSLHPPLDTHKNRYSRETSESILPMSTTSQLPEPVEDEVTEGSGAEIQAVRCNTDTRMRKTLSKCKTLQEVLSDYFERFIYSMPLDSVYNIFVLDDIHFFGLLGGESNSRSNSQRPQNYGATNCAAILEHHHRPQNISAGRCSWNYTCSYDPNTFPRFRVQASLLNPDTRDLYCEEVRRSRVMYFEREKCPGDPCEGDNWREEVTSIIVGYVELPMPSI